MSGDEETRLTSPAARADAPHGLDDDAATLASQDTSWSHRSRDSRRNRGYPTDSTSQLRSIDDEEHHARNRRRSRDRSSSRRGVSRSHHGSLGRGRFDSRSSDRYEIEGGDYDRYQRGQSYAPPAERVYQHGDFRDFRGGRSSSVASARSELPFKRGRRHGSVSKSPSRLMQSRSKDYTEWPPCFDVDGTAFVFHPASGMFYEEKSEFFYDPKTKLYYGAKKFSYFIYDETRDPPFIEAQRVDPTQGTPTNPTEPPVTLPPVNALSTHGMTEKMKIAINLKTKKIKHPKMGINPGVAETSAKTISKVQKEQAANIEKWKEKQTELKTLSTLPASYSVPISAAVAVEEIKRTMKGEPICVVCKRKFPTVEKLRLHESKSELHKANVAKMAQLAGEKRKVEATWMESKQEYNDRAEKRRHMYGSEMSEGLSAKVTSSALAVTPIVAETLGEDNIGNKILQKMGWQGGAAIGKKAEEGGSDKSSTELRKEWERIEAMAAKSAPSRLGN